MAPWQPPGSRLPGKLPSSSAPGQAPWQQRELADSTGWFRPHWQEIDAIRSLDRPATGLVELVGAIQSME